MTEITWPDTGELTRYVKISAWLDVPAALDESLDARYSGDIYRWAKRQPVAGIANWQGQQIDESVTDIWWFRHGTGTKPEDLGGEKVIEFKNRRWRIIRAMNAGDADRFTMVWAKDLGEISA